MKIKKIIVLILLPFIAEYFTACCRRCEESVYKKYTNANFGVVNLDNAQDLPKESYLDSINKDAYGFRILSVIERTASSMDRRSILFYSANAFSCECPEPLQYLPQDSIVDIKVFTLNDFNQTHLSNSEVTQYFKYFKEHTFSSIPDFLKREVAIIFDDTTIRKDFDFLLMEAPEANMMHQFKVFIKLSDDRSIELETTAVKLF